MYTNKKNTEAVHAKTTIPSVVGILSLISGLLIIDLGSTASANPLREQMMNVKMNTTPISKRQINDQGVTIFQWSNNYSS